MKTSNLSDYDLYLFHQGTNYRAYEMLGAHFLERNGKKGVRFALWSPHAKSVSVVGNFNNWDQRANPMKLLSDGETWETFIEGLNASDTYKYSIQPNDDGASILKADPYGFWSEQCPNTASKIYNLDGYTWTDDEWQELKKRQSSYSHPMLIYEVHAGSWCRQASYRELADKLISYVKEMNYTHIEFMPLTEHADTWGYQTTGYYAATSRYGEPNDLRYLIETAHKNGIGVIMDWVLGHFSEGLRKFDGEQLYEAENNFDYGRTEVQSFLISNALFWFDEFHIDGLRIDGVANMLYVNYGREENCYDDSGNLEAVEFLKKLNETVFKYNPQALMIAEESSSWPLISKPIYMGGIGFNYKWNMGWVNDMLEYVSLDPIYRKWNHDKVTFSFMYAFAENFILPLSHDEVVHGKRSLIEKMPCDYWQKFAGLRCLFGYWMSHPGKKLLFMGGEFGQIAEWNENGSLDWHLIEQSEKHKQMQNYSRALNKFYLDNKSLWQVDFDWNGFQWIDCNDNENSVISFIRKAEDSTDYVIVVCNFTPKTHEGYRIGVPNSGAYVEVFNSNAEEFGGSGVGNPATLLAEEFPWHNRNHSITLTIPPLATIFLKPTCDAE